jgi:ribonuclease P protein component
MTAVPEKRGAPRRLKKRSEFLRAARGNRAGRSAFSLQAIAAQAAEPGVGFTVTKKTGNAPERNRIRRRLREAARLGRKFEPDMTMCSSAAARLELAIRQARRRAAAAINKIHASTPRPLDKT